MKKIIYISFAALVLGACSKEVSEPENAPEYYTFNAVFDEATKVTFGEPSAVSIALQWKDGDEVGFTLEKNDDSKVTRKGTINVDGETVTVTLDLTNAKNGWESIEDIWYPYNGGTKLAAIPTTQSYDCVAVPVQKTAITASTVTFGTYLPYVVLEFPVTQTAHLNTKFLTDVRHTPVSTTLSSLSVAVSSGDTYTVDSSADSGIDLKSLNSERDGSGRVTAIKTYYLVIPPIDSKDITVTYVTRDGQHFSKTKSDLTLSSKAYRKMPSLDLTGYHFWNFGSSHTNTDCNGLVYWFREVQKPSATHSISTDYLTTSENYLTIIPDTADEQNYNYYLTPLWGGGALDYRFCSNGSTLMSNSSGEEKITLSQSFPIFAIAIDRPKGLEGQSGVNPCVIDPNGSGSFKSRVIYDENNTSRNTAMIYAQMANTDNILASQPVADALRIQLKLSIAFSTVLNSEDDSYSTERAKRNLKVYWAGTFRTEDEAKAYYNSYFGY